MGACSGVALAETRLLTHDQPLALVETQRALLEAQGIHAEVVPGYLPHVARLRVRAEDVAVAQVVLAVGDQDERGSAPCPNCGADVPATFAVCWQCNHAIDDPDGEPLPAPPPEALPDLSGLSEAHVGTEVAAGGGRSSNTVVVALVLALLGSNAAWYLVWSRPPGHGPHIGQSSMGLRCVTDYWAHNGAMAAQYCDAWWDGFFEDVLSFDQAGVRVSRMVDEDGDLVYDAIQTFDRAGRLASLSELDALERTARLVELDDDGRSFEWTDPDQDGRMERRVTRSPSGEVVRIEVDGPEGFRVVGP